MEVSGIIFGRMTVNLGEGIDYLVTDEDKNQDVPILVSVDKERLNIPVRINRSHINDPNNLKSYTGSPSAIRITDEAAVRLIEDAKKVNPNQDKNLERILKIIK